MPGLDDELIEQIVAYRRENKFQGNGDVAQVVPAEQMATLRRWLNSTKSGTHFSILVYQKDPENAASPEELEEEAYEEREEREEQEKKQLNSKVAAPQINAMSDEELTAEMRRRTEAKQS